jgi:hypothetical protein
MTFTGLDYMINTSDFSQEAGTVIFMVVPVLLIRF